MNSYEAKRQLCKMQGEVADYLELKTLCVCDDPRGSPKEGEVPDEVISELWSLLADGRQYRKWRDHVEDFIQNSKTMSGFIKRIAEQLEGKDRELLEEAVEHYDRNFTITHYFAAVGLKKIEAEKSRWVTLKKTSNSGKALFVCTVCGRVSPTPDKTCKTFEDPEESLACSRAETHSGMTPYQELEAFEKVARAAGWSEEVNCPPWSFLEDCVNRSRESER